MLSQAGIDIIERFQAIVAWLTHTQKVQIGAIQNKDVQHY